MQRMAREVLDELPTPRDRALIVGFYVEGRSKIQLMGELQLDAAHFDRVIFRACTRMRDRIRDKMCERQNLSDAPVSRMGSGHKGR